MSEEWDDNDDWGDGGDDDWDEGGSLPDDPSEINEGERWRIDVENLFFNAESDKRAHRYQEALNGYRECAKLEEEKTDDIEKRFDAYKNIIMLLNKSGETEEMIESYQKLLSYSNRVTPNDLTQAVRAILGSVSDTNNAQRLTKIYSITLNSFKRQSGKERLWFEFAMRLCKTYMDLKDYERGNQLLEELHNSCRMENGEDDLSKGSQLLEIYAMEIQIMTAQNNDVGLSELFHHTNILATDINDPRSMSIIKECWGKMYASQGLWDKAYAEFFEAFRQYQDIGHQNVKTCLKYVIISSMLSEESTNPFATQEAGVYQQDDKIMGVASLLEAFENDDIRKFENTLYLHKKNILDDEFIQTYLPSVKLRLRSRVLIKLIKPYTRVTLKWLCRQLNATDVEIEQLVVNLILDGSVQGRLDQINSLLDLSWGTSSDNLYTSLEQWMSTLKKLQGTITSRSSHSSLNRGIPTWDYDDDDQIAIGGDDYGNFF